MNATADVLETVIAFESYQCQILVAGSSQKVADRQTVEVA